jgi:hypothetical protein
MSSKVEIANIALAMIGGTRITDFTDGSRNANVISDIYDPLRRHLLSYPWNFSTVRAELAQLSNVPEFEWDHAYALPSDWIYTLEVSDNNGGLGTIPYREEQQDNQNVLLANSNKVYLVYAKDEVDTNMWSPNFRRAMAMSLARDLAVVIANSNTLQQSMTRAAVRALNMAKSTDSITDFPRRRPRGTWANSRNGLRSGSGTYWV